MHNAIYNDTQTQLYRINITLAKQILCTAQQLSCARGLVNSVSFFPRVQQHS